ncbi:cysteine ABC transporter ATP-binding protein [Paenibacillus sp. J23TS9]|uniref:SCO family protein n=1 Tax=Paenibacillus sp. J23TS9 TaxID=2807193 RepID=UPI001B0EE81E|nr:SCO family protein [Paenibacillus sp. J23TS9]GIP26132.1 cysteine ABC transporter ATP-binding protein [Paenibacillus sp. J23TS9]
MVKTRNVLLAVCLICILLVTACGDHKPDKLNIKLESFQSIDQEGNRKDISDLKGKIWVADFMFTHCTTVCPILTSNMAELQQELKDAGIKADLVSFSVDPENDHPEAIKTYISKFSDDFTNWQGLTGYSFDDIQTYARNNFKMAIQKDTASDQVIHGTSFFLVDQTGTVVSYYDGQEPPYDKIKKDIKALERS